ncbi:hypothetical protein F5884DRAFT_782716 [Xylogone sp. PMI_703]|nr:hypothetical protein F5884DRAFT_782716 [Xylogone sp. PMI_703]
MADPKARIVSHMNAEHQESLTLYLRHFNKLSASSAAKNPILQDITPAEMTISTSDGKTHIVPFTPPMDSLSDARFRTVEMDTEARKALGVAPIEHGPPSSSNGAAPSAGHGGHESSSPIIIKEYTPPRSLLHITVAALCLLGYVAFATKSYIVPGTPVYELLDKYFPGGTKGMLWTTRMIQWPVILLHILETAILDSRLAKYGVRRGSGVWAAWVGSCMIEGFGSLQRVEAIVRREKRKAQ